jgi:hypothetical protein
VRINFADPELKPDGADSVTECQAGFSIPRGGVRLARAVEKITGPQRDQAIEAEKCRCGPTIALFGPLALYLNAQMSARFGERDLDLPSAHVRTIDIAIATLDDPEAIAPGFQIWTRSQIGWFDTTDQFDRHERFRPETEGLNDLVAAGAPDRPGSTDAAPADDINPLAPPINIEEGA